MDDITAQITKLNLADNDLLIVKVDTKGSTNPIMGMRKIVAQVQDQIKATKYKGVQVMAFDKSVNIETLNEEAMKKHGWIRKSKEEK